MKKSGYLQRTKAKKEAEIRQAETFAIQYAFDAATLAISDVFGAGPKKAKEFADAFGENLLKISTEITKDHKDDKDVVYARECIDRAILKIVGPENFVPYDERYK